MVLTFLAPNLPPCVCGVGDHTVHMADALHEAFPIVTGISLNSQFAETGTPFDRIDHWDGRAKSLLTLVESHESDCLWVQYSGYGYGYQGVPQFLENALRIVSGKVNLVVYFHQVHCKIKKLGLRGLVLSPWQRRIAKNIAQSADIVFTSCELYRELIAEEYEVPSDRVLQLPIGSNIPIPPIDIDERNRLRSLLGWSSDQKVAVVFGSLNSQKRALKQNLELLSAALRQKTIDRVVCIGGDETARLEEFDLGCDPQLRCHTVVMGYQPAERVAEMLQAADIALTWCPYNKFGKSGSMMAYALAGLPVLTYGHDARVNLGYTGSFVRTCSLNEIDEATSDPQCRLKYQKRALEAIGWDALANRAVGALSAISSWRYR